MGEACAWLSRLLLLLAAIEVITMPLTQHLWAWDGFVRGGPDFELGLLMIVMCVCLGLLRAQHGRLRVSWLLAIREWLLEVWRPRLWRSRMPLERFAMAAGAPSRLRSAQSETPLRI